MNRCAPLVLLVAAAAALAGCANSASLDAGRCVTGPDAGVLAQRGGEGAVDLTVLVLHEGIPSRDVVVCVRLDDRDQFGALILGGEKTPNVRTVAEGVYVPGDSGLRVGAFVLDDDESALATFPLTAQNVVTIIIEKSFTLRIEKRDAPVGSA